MDCYFRITGRHTSRDRPKLFFKIERETMTNAQLQSKVEALTGRIGELDNDNRHLVNDRTALLLQRDALQYLVDSKTALEKDMTIESLEEQNGKLEKELKKSLDSKTAYETAAHDIPVLERMAMQAKGSNRNILLDVQIETKGMLITVSVVPMINTYTEGFRDDLPMVIQQVLDQHFEGALLNMINDGAIATIATLREKAAAELSNITETKPED